MTIMRQRRRADSDLPPYPGAPRWVKVFWSIIIAVVLLLLALMIGRSGHGPGRHLSSNEAVGQSPSSTVTLDHASTERGQ